MISCQRSSDLSLASVEEAVAAEARSGSRRAPRRGRDAIDHDRSTPARSRARRARRAGSRAAKGSAGPSARSTAQGVGVLGGVGVASRSHGVSAEPGSPGAWVGCSCDLLVQHWRCCRAESRRRGRTAAAQPDPVATSCRPRGSHPAGPDPAAAPAASRGPSSSGRSPGERAHERDLLARGRRG